VAYIIYILLFPVIFLVSRLPYWFLYRLSDGLYFIIYYLVGYRKSTVRQNIALVFPNKSIQERKKIEKAFYKHFSDLFVEMIKAFHMPLKQMKKHFVFNNPELLNQLSAQGKNIVIVGGHYANWEWVFSLASLTDALPIATYLKINNPYFEKFMLRNRSRFGGLLVETKQLRQTVAKLSQEKQLFILGLLADQSPQKHRVKYWRSFFGVPDVPVFVGPEKLAKQYDAAFVFMYINKQKRGYYSVDFELITDQSNTYTDYQLTDIFVDKLDNQVRKNPAYYLWTHKRFKHQGKQPKK